MGFFFCLLRIYTGVDPKSPPPAPLLNTLADGRTAIALPSLHPLILPPPRHPSVTPLGVLSFLPSFLACLPSRLFHLRHLPQSRVGGGGSHDDGESEEKRSQEELIPPRGTSSVKAARRSGTGICLKAVFPLFLLNQPPRSKMLPPHSQTPDRVSTPRTTSPPQPKRVISIW